MVNYLRQISRQSSFTLVDLPQTINIFDSFFQENLLSDIDLQPDIFSETTISATTAVTAGGLPDNVLNDALATICPQPILQRPMAFDESRRRCLEVFKQFKNQLLSDIKTRADGLSPPLSSVEAPMIVNNPKPVLRNNKGLCFHNSAIELLFGISQYVDFSEYLKTLTIRCTEQSIYYSGDIHDYQVVKSLAAILPMMRLAKSNTGMEQSTIDCALNELLKDYQKTQLKEFFEKKNRNGTSYYQNNSFQSEFSDAVAFCNRLLKSIQDLHNLYTPVYRYQGEPFEDFLFPSIQHYNETFSHDGSTLVCHSQVDSGTRLMHEMNLQLDELQNTDTLQTIYFKSLTDTNHPENLKSSYPEMASASQVMLLSFSYPYLVSDSKAIWTKKKISELITPILEYSHDIINIIFRCSTDNYFHECWYNFDTMLVYYSPNEESQGHYVIIQKDGNRWIIIDDIKRSIPVYHDWYSALSAVDKYAFPVLIASRKLGESIPTKPLISVTQLNI